VFPPSRAALVGIVANPQVYIFGLQRTKKLAAGKNNLCRIRKIKLVEEFLILFLLASKVSGGVNKRNVFSIFALLRLQTIISIFKNYHFWALFSEKCLE
jgi:hypothetical protein